MAETFRFLGEVWGWKFDQKFWGTKPENLDQTEDLYTKS